VARPAGARPLPSGPPAASEPDPPPPPAGREPGAGWGWGAGGGLGGEGGCRRASLLVVAVRACVHSWR